MDKDKLTDKNTDPAQNPDKGSTRPARPLWRRILKWISVTMVSLILLFVIICSLVVWILTPDRLTPLVEQTASDYLNADLRADRVELTFWKSFPMMTLDVDSLRIISRSLDNAPDSLRAAIPAGADSLMSVGHLHAGVNVVKLLTGEIALRDLLISRPQVNLVALNDSLTNYNIFPPSESPDTARSEVVIPPLSINSFRILDSGALRFRSIPDSTDLSARLRNLIVDSPDQPLYTLDIDGNAEIPALRELGFDPMGFGLDGNLTWDSRDPYSIRAEDLKLQLDNFILLCSAEADFSGSPVVKSLTATLPDLPVQEALTHLPADLRGYTDPLETDMHPTLELSLTSPWAVADSALPSFKASLDIPDCKAKYQTLTLRRFGGTVAVNFDGQDPDLSVIDLSRLDIAGEGVTVALNTIVTTPLSNPRLKGHFRGEINLSRIPPRLAAELPVTLSGIIKGETSFRFSKKDLTRDNFHRVMADGSIQLLNISADAPGLMTASLGHARLDFGTSDSFVRDGHKVDSLLRVSLKVDTLSALGSGIDLQLKELMAGVGTANRQSSADTAEINPFGGKISIGRLKFDLPDDSIRIRLRDASVGGALRRYKGEARKPRADLVVAAKRMMFGQGLTRFSLRETDMHLAIHPRQRPNRRRQMNPDSIAADTLRRIRMAADTLTPLDRQADVDFDIDDKERAFLRNWDFNGSLKAKRGRMVTPWFPLRNTITNIDLTFSPDSVVLSKLGYRCGGSDFEISGTISNMRRALLSRRHKAALGISFDMQSDTINVNEIVTALFAGSTAAAHTDSDDVWDDQAVETDRETAAAPADTAAAGPLLLPRNIDGVFRMRVRHVLYSDIELTRLRGSVMLYDGALNLRNLSATADVGSISLNGLYTSLHPDSLQFGLGMQIRDFRIDRFTRMFPAIDSLLPAMNSFSGIVNADIAMSTGLDHNMDIDIPTLQAAVSISGDSLVLLDPDTFKSLSKWLMFKNKKRNIIDHMSVEIVVENSAIELYPFMFDIDRYRLGVMGRNDLAMNLDYHVSVLKSPLPFKFGINIKGTPEKMKIRLGGAKFKENMVVERTAIADNTRINLVRQIDNIFRKGISNARLGRLNFHSGSNNGSGSGSNSGSSSVGGSNSGSRRPGSPVTDLEEPTLTPADSLRLIEAGLLDPAEAPAPTNPD